MPTFMAHISIAGTARISMGRRETVPVSFPNEECFLPPRHVRYLSVLSCLQGPFYYYFSGKEFVPSDKRLISVSANEVQDRLLSILLASMSEAAKTDLNFPVLK